MCQISSQALIGSSMAKMLLVLLVLLPTLQASFVDTYNWVNIDCGAEAPTLDTKNSLNWETDAAYITTGVNNNISVATATTVTQFLKTLRYFPDGDTNCYSFSVDAINTYLVRARFYYGNYDGQTKPPSFNISVNGHMWTTIITSIAGQDPVVIEGAFKVGSDVLHVCLVRGSDGVNGVPFISSLEVTPWPFNTYMNIDLYSAFLLQSRINFGGKEDISYNGNYTGDQLNRIWKAEGLPGYRNVSSIPDYITYVTNQPPDSVLSTAVEAQTTSSSIIINLNLNPDHKLSCVMMYFAQLNASREKNETRNFRIDVGGQKNLSTTIDLSSPQLATLYLQGRVDGAATNITISPVEGSTLPPIVNAMEVYSIMDMNSPFTPPSGGGGVQSSWILLLVCLFSAMVMVM